MSRSLIPVCLITLLAAGCTWVKPTPEGEKVRLLEAHEVTGCEELGKTTVSLRDKLIFGVDRAAAKVQWELRTLAFNSAARMGGDTVVALSPVEDGQQVYGVYKCVGVK